MVIGCALTACAQSAISPPTLALRETIRPQTATQSIYVENCRYGICGLLEEIPAADIGQHHLHPTQVFKGESSDLWVAFDKSGRRYMAGQGYISVYPPGATATTARQAYLTIPQRQGYAGIAIDKHGNIWTAAGEVIFEYPPLAANARGSFTLSPIKRISGSKTHLAARNLMFDPTSGYLYVRGEFAILAFDSNGSGNVAPVVNIPGQNAAFTIDQKGRILTVDGAISVYKRSATGGVQSVATIDGNFTNVVTDAQDNIYAIEVYYKFNIGRSRLVEFSPLKSGYANRIHQSKFHLQPFEAIVAFIVH